MSQNKTFFRNAQDGHMTLRDIFSDVTKRHTPEDTARVLTAGTVLTTPDEKYMLSQWQKPFLFARFFLGYALFLLIAYLLGSLVGFPGGYYLLMIGMPFLVPITILLLVWEMNISRNISLYEIITITALGGLLSLVIAAVASMYTENTEAVWAGLIEEPAKLAIVYIILRKKNYKYALNGALLGAAVGTGFAVMESLIYVVSNMANGLMYVLYACYENSVSLRSILEEFSVVWYSGISSGLSVALARAFTAISGHGIFAALYGSALVNAKGKDEINLSHLLKPEFLIYLGISVLLHALHNYGLDLKLPALFGGLLPSEYIIIAGIAIALLLHVLRIGVNQVVSIAMAQNDDRLTYAVEADKQPVPKNVPENIPAAAPSRNVKLQCLTGAMAGQKFRCKEGQSFTMGRDANKNTIALFDYSHVSTVHCRIEIIQGRVFVTDLTSRNGTYLDEQRLTPNQPMPAMNGSVLVLGNKDCAFKIYIQ